MEHNEAWAFKWSGSHGGRPGPFFLNHLVRSNRKEVIDHMIANWMKDGESRKNVWRRISARGGRVVKVRLVEILGKLSE